jgi:hypothetical protein
MTIREYQELRDRLERLQQDYNRCEGALDQHLKRLREEFGFETVEQATEALAGMEREEAEADQAFQQALRELDEQFIAAP